MAKFEQSSEKKAKLQDTIKRPKKVDGDESTGGHLLDSKLTAGPSTQQSVQLSNQATLDTAQKSVFE